MYKNSLLANSVRFALISGAAATAAITAPTAFAADESANVERISVTGSRIKRVDIEGANPVTVIERSQLEDLGITDIGQLIQKLPAMNGGVVTSTTNNGGSGAVTVNLRGLGSIRTLVLINGKRTVDGGDFQTIPASMIKRVEILKDGASAIYGADAVAGVVNIITRNDFEGVEISVQRKEWTEITDGAANDSVSLIAGKAFDGGNIVFGAEYNKQEGAVQGQYEGVKHFQEPLHVGDVEDFEKNGLTDDNSVFWGSSRIPNGRFLPNGATGGQVFDPSLAGCSGSVPASTSCFRDANNDFYNYSPVNYLQTPFERINVFTEGNFEISDSVRFESAIRLSNRKSIQRLAPMPYDSRFDPGANVRDADGNAAQGISADSYYNPFGVDVTDVRRRVTESNREFSQDVTNVQAVAGFSGEFAEVWEWNATYNWGYRTRTDIDKGQFVAANIANALGASFMDTDGVVKCGEAGAIIEGCTPMNMFGEGNISQEALDYVEADLTDTYNTRQDVLTLNLTNSELFELPAGYVGMSVGYEYRDEQYTYSPDSGKAKGAVSGNKGAGTEGGYRVNSLFGEFVVPILAGVPGAELLEANVGVRYDNFSSFGGNTSVQGSLKYMPISSLLVRATAGNVFRAPSVDELFSSPADDFDQAVDPCSTINYGGLSADGQARCMASGVAAGGYEQTDTQVRGRSGGNPELQPEEGDTFTVGLAWSPEFIDGFSLTVDYWDIELTKGIDGLGAQATMDLCYEEGIDEACGQINRMPSGNIDTINTTNLNLADEKATGLDTEITYSFSTSIGDWRTSLNWTHLIEREKTAYEGADVIELNGRIDTSTARDVYPTDKANFFLNWGLEDISITYSAEYISSIESPYFFFDEQDQHIESQLYHDITGSYIFPTNTKITLGVTNITDEKAPYLDQGFNASTIPETYRVNGRGAFVRISQKF
ncbi:MULTISPECIES: TonB-dependent receptor domain-containing protein [Shewanella]|nr:MULTISPECIES: TonB-dependent receptor [Shewanella]